MPGALKLKGDQGDRSFENKSAMIWSSFLAPRMNDAGFWFDIALSFVSFFKEPVPLIRVNDAGFCFDFAN